MFMAWIAIVSWRQNAAAGLHKREETSELA
jgi:hypothetical protein